MAKDRIFFLLSFAFIGIVAAFLFSKKAKEPEAPPPQAKTPQVEEVKAPEVLPPADGKIAVPVQLTSRSGIVQFLTPGKYVDIIFTSKPEGGVGTVTFTLLKNVRILGIGKDAEGKFFTDKASLYKSNNPIEILLEMLPRQSEIFAFAQLNGDVTIGIEDKQAAEHFHETEKLVQDLLKSRSDQNFNSILVSHMLRKLFPKADIQIIATTKGFIVSGYVPDQQTSDNIVKILNMLSAGGSKDVVNLVELESNSTKEINSGRDLTSFSVAANKRAVLLELNARFPIIPDLHPGSIVDVKFTSKADIGFKPVSLTLLRNVEVLSIGRNIIGKKLEQRDALNPDLPVQVILAMDPLQARIFAFAVESGIVTLDNTNSSLLYEDSGLLEMLFDSDSLEDFQSILVTYMINTLFPLVNTTVTSTPRGYIVEGMVPDPQMATKIIEIISKLVPRGDKAVINLLDVEPQQVLIAIKVFEVKKDILSRVGINWKVLFQNANQSFAVGSVFPSPPLTDPNYFLNGQGIFGNYQLSALIDMLEEDTGTKVLAEPNLTTVSGETAHFFAGGEFPILIPQGGTLIGTVTVEFKKFGVLLDFTPTVDLNGLITLHVVPEVSALDRANSVILEGFVIPGLTIRRVDTIVKLWPGQSYIIAGMYLDEMTNTNDNLYGLNKIPIIGSLFNSNRYQDQKTELVVIATPYLMHESRPPAGIGPCSNSVEIDLMNSANNCAVEVEPPCDFVETPWEPSSCAL